MKKPQGVWGVQQINSFFQEGAGTSKQKVNAKLRGFTSKRDKLVKLLKNRRFTESKRNKNIGYQV